MADIIMIPLTKLVESEDNVRRSNRKGGIVGACCQHSCSRTSTRSGRSRQPTKASTPSSPAAGACARCGMLAKAGDIEKNAPIPCRVVSADEAAEMSLAENIVRLDLSPADEILRHCASSPTTGLASKPSPRVSVFRPCTSLAD